MTVAMRSLASPASRRSVRTGAVSSSSDPAVSEFYGPNRRLYLPDMKAPEWLDGSMAGECVARPNHVLLHP
eukprot:jgi/Ulvmu1/5714/UM024_0065.1